MADYIYICPNCGHEQEEKHPMAECDSVVIRCAKCKEVMRRKPTPFRFRMEFVG